MVNFFSEPSLQIRISGRWALIRHADITLFNGPQSPLRGDSSDDFNKAY
jgi:hypothetical protein